MRKLKRLGIISIALTFFFGAFAVTDSNAQGLLNKILKRMDAHKDALQSLEADVSMSKTDSTLGITDTTSGNTYYLPGKGKDVTVRINWTKPLEETLVSKGGKYILYRPRLKQAIVGNVSEANSNTKTNSALDFMNMSKKELSSNYKIVMLENVKKGSEELWHLKLTPIARKTYKYAELWVDGDGMPIQAKIVEQNNDSTTVRLSNIKKNITIKADVFNFKIPAGTNKVKG